MPFVESIGTINVQVLSTQVYYLGNGNNSWESSGKENSNTTAEDIDSLYKPEFYCL